MNSISSGYEKRGGDIIIGMDEHSVVGEHGSYFTHSFGIADTLQRDAVSFNYNDNNARSRDMLLILEIIRSSNVMVIRFKSLLHGEM